MAPPRYSESSVPLLDTTQTRPNPQNFAKMKNILSEPILGLTWTIAIFLLSFTGSIFLWVLSYPYSHENNLQFGHLLADDEARAAAVRNLIIASVFYGILAILMVFQLVLHLKQSRRQSWDPAIAMVNVHTPKLDNSAEATRKRHTPSLSTSTLSTAADDSQAGRYRGTGANIPK